MKKTSLTRGDFLKGVGGMLAALAGSRVFRRKASASESAGSSPHHWVMVIDQAKCTGCGYCTLACQAHNDVPPTIFWNRVIHAGKVRDEDVYLPRPCMHCDEAPCVEVCPVKATTKRADGIVMMDYDLCIGCRYCEVACPYSARAFNWETFIGDNPAVPEWGEPEVERRPRGVIEKCSFCYQRIDRGLVNGLEPGVDQDATPACVVFCPVGARIFGDLNEPRSQVSQWLADNPSFRLREDLGTAPRVVYLPPRQEVAS